MNTIARTTTLRRLNRGFSPYEHLQKTSKTGRTWRAFSTRRTTTRLAKLKQAQIINYDTDTTMSPVYEKRDRARSRHVFLQGYNLSMYATSKDQKVRSEIKMKRAMVKVKRMVVSVLSFMRVASLNKCNSKSAIAVAPATRMNRCF